MSDLAPNDPGPEPTDARTDDDLEQDGIDPSKVVAAPGTGGSDDAGDVEPESGDLHLPWQSEEDRRP